MYGHQEGHGTIRGLVYAHMSQHRDRFKVFEVNFDRRLSSMRRDGTWGGEPEIRAMEELYNRPIAVYEQVDESTFRLIESQQSLIYPEEMKDVTPMKLLFRNHHYDSLVATSGHKVVPERRGFEILNHRVENASDVRNSLTTTTTSSSLGRMDSRTTDDSSSSKEKEEEKRDEADSRSSVTSTSELNTDLT